jgi:hypothetical protein
MRHTQDREHFRGSWCPRSRATRCAVLAGIGLAALTFPARAQLTVDGSRLFAQGLDGMQGGPGEDHELGYRVAVGDFNGDGRLDLAAAAPGMELLGLAQAGGVHVIYGGDAGLDTENPDDQVIGLGHLGMPGVGHPFERFSWGGIAVGDFDGDGYDDLAVGSHFDVVDGVSKGSVLVVHGGPAGLAAVGALYLTPAEVPLPPHLSHHRFGSSVGTGDFDGNGYDDLVIGHRATVDGVEAAGAVTVLYGSPASLVLGPGTQTFHQGADGIPGTPQEFDLFGSSLAGGDFNGDGFDDLAIGAVADHVAADQHGSVTVLFGSAAGLDSHSAIEWLRELAEPSGPAASTPQFGFRVAAGDFDADGYDDLVATDSSETAAGTSTAGAVYLRHGGPSGLGDSQRLIPGTSPVPVAPVAGLRFGSTLVVADFDGNGYDDLAVATSPDGADGVSVLYSGPEGFDSSWSQIFSPTTAGLPGNPADRLGFGSGLAAGDLDGNGVADLVVGIGRHRIAGLDQAGAVLVLPGFDRTLCQPTTETHCLHGGRFKVEVEFVAPGEEPRAAQVVPAVAHDSALFWFFAEANWEVLVKVLDGCVVNSHFWVFSAATTNVPYTLRVTDMETGDVREYESPPGAAQSQADTAAFASCGVGGPVVLPPLPAGSSQDACPGDSETLCLHGGRFLLTVEWTTPDGSGSGTGQVVPFGTSDSGLFWFFDGQNWELLVKVLDGCPVNARFWVFSAATTNVGYTLRVHDRATGVERVYVNPPGVLAKAVTDTNAFTGCS